MKYKRIRFKHNNLYSKQIKNYSKIDKLKNEKADTKSWSKIFRIWRLLQNFDPEPYKDFKGINRDFHNLLCELFTTTRIVKSFDNSDLTFEKVDIKKIKVYFKDKY